MLTRLHKLKCDYEKENQENTSSHSHEDNQRHFGIFGQEPKQSPEKKVSSESPTGSHSRGENPQDSSLSCPTQEEKSVKSESNSRRESMKRALSPSYYSDDLYRFKRGRIREDSISKFSLFLVAELILIYKAFWFFSCSHISFICGKSLFDLFYFLHVVNPQPLPLICYTIYLHNIFLVWKVKESDFIVNI